MTTLAIIGGGIMGRSLLFSLAREKKSFNHITLFSGEKFAPLCTLNSTAVVAPRGITRGHSQLGDLLCDGFEVFKDHVYHHDPLGVEKVSQFTAATEKVETFLRRYPSAEKRSSFFKRDILLAQEEGFIIDPRLYSEWLLDMSRQYFGESLTCVRDFIQGLNQSQKIELLCHSGKKMIFDKVIFAGGASNRYWRDAFCSSSLLDSKPVQGHYLEFNNCSLDLPSLSLTLNGDNFIWSQAHKRLLMGSVSSTSHCMIPQSAELMRVYDRLHALVDLSLPKKEEGVIKSGTREKAKKRMPYIAREENLIFVGGLYKNGFVLSLKLAQDIIGGHL